MTNPKIALEFAVHEINTVLAGLAKLPFEAVHEIIAMIQKEGGNQLTAHQVAQAAVENTEAPLASSEAPQA